MKSITVKITDRDGAYADIDDALMLIDAQNIPSGFEWELSAQTLTSADIITMLHELHVTVKNPVYGLPLHSQVETEKMIAVVRKYLGAKQ